MKALSCHIGVIVSKHSLYNKYQLPMSKNKATSGVTGSDNMKTGNCHTIVIMSLYSTQIPKFNSLGP